MKTVLVTGGAGFIGSHACICLLEQNYNIVVLDSNVNSTPNSLIGVKNIVRENVKSFIKLKFVKGDIRDEDILRKIFFEANNSKNPITVGGSTKGIVKNPSIMLFHFPLYLNIQ